MRFRHMATPTVEASLMTLLGNSRKQRDEVSNDKS